MIFIIKKILLFTFFVFFGCLKSNIKEITENEITIEKIRKDIEKTGLAISLVNKEIIPSLYYFVEDIAKDMGSPMPKLFLINGFFSKMNKEYGEKIDNYIEHSGILKLYNLSQLAMFFPYELIKRDSFLTKIQDNEVKSRLDYAVSLLILFQIFTSRANAFAFSFTPKLSAIFLGTNLINKLTKEELSAIIAHELGHIKHYDYQKLLVLNLAQKLIHFFAEKYFMDFSIRRFFPSQQYVLSSKFDLNMKIFDFFYMMLISYISKMIEQKADLASLNYTKNPELLISALEKMDQIKKESSKLGYFVDHIYLKYMWFLCSHPTLEKRTSYLTEAAQNLA